MTGLIYEKTKIKSSKNNNMKKESKSDYLRRRLLTTPLWMLKLLILLVIWLHICNLVQAYKCPGMTGTELLFHLPKSFVLDWEECR